MRNKEWCLNILFVFIAFYFGIALIGKFIFKKEIYPFYHWSLYSYVPQNAKQITLQLTHIDNERIKPVNLLTKKELMFANPIEVNSVLESFYNCLMSNCEAKKEKEIQLLSLIPLNCNVSLIEKNGNNDHKLIAVINNQKIVYVK